MSADIVIKPTISVDGRYFSLAVECHDAFSVAYRLDNGQFLRGRQVGFNRSGYRVNTGMMPSEMSVKITTFDALHMVIKRFVSDNDKLSSSIDVLFVHQNSFDIVETFMVWPASFYSTDYRQDLVMWPGLTVMVRGQGFDQNVIVK